MAGGRQSRQGGGAGGGKVGQGGASLPRAWATANDCSEVEIQGSCNAPYFQGQQIWWRFREADLLPVCGELSSLIFNLNNCRVSTIYEKSRTSCLRL